MLYRGDQRADGAAAEAAGSTIGLEPAEYG